MMSVELDTYIKYILSIKYLSWSHWAVIVTYNYYKLGRKYLDAEFT